MHNNHTVPIQGLTLLLIGTRHRALLHPPFLNLSTPFLTFVVLRSFGQSSLAYRLASSSVESGLMHRLQNGVSLQKQSMYMLLSLQSDQ